MRQLLTSFTAAAVIFSGAVSAQQAHRPHITSAKRHFVAPFQSKWKQATGPAAKTTAVDVRLVGLTELEYNGSSYMPIDSIEIGYLGLHAGTFNDLRLNWEWDFDTAYARQWTGSTYGPREYRYWQNFNSANLADTSMNDEWAGTAWQQANRSFYTFDAANNVLSITSENWDAPSSSWVSSDRQLFSYTPSNKLENETYQSWSGSGWDDMYRVFHFWSTPGLLVQDSSQYYDASAPGWVDLQKIMYTYDGSDNRIQGVATYWADTTWDTVGFYYASGFVANHQPQTIVYTDASGTPGVYDSSYKENYTYNSYGKPTYYYDEDWDAATNAWVKTTSDIANRMYYEEYGAGVGVGKDITKQIDITVFPVPASYNLTVSANWGTPQTFSASITDMVGRTYTTWSGKTNGQYHETIPVNNLAAGNYILTVHTKQGNVTKQFSVVR
ncbi:MAG: T9SS type A sorting domain-containing protein [Taibaiella sp.]|nr:T9SS type A sorting domain-containing protein [Taibaiella sp.]